MIFMSTFLFVSMAFFAAKLDASESEKSKGAGAECKETIDCMANMSCIFTSCQCNPGYFNENGTQNCTKAISPGDGPCKIDQECESGWPRATCDAVTRLCACPKNTFAVDTQDGRVCIPLSGSLNTAVCPTPEGFDGIFLGAMQDTVAAMPPVAKFACTLGSVTQTTSCNNVLATAAAIGNQDTIYDCIPFTLAGLNRAAAQGICCPSRAFTCIQPMRATIVGVIGVNLEIRYWYNSITNLCEKFTWSNKDALSNSNNFRTIEHCLSYCRGTARRGAPKLTDRTAPTQPISRIVTCSQDETCVTAGKVVFACNSTANPAHCLSMKASTCSSAGGRIYTTIPSDFDEGLHSSAAESKAIGNPRFYWNGKECSKFTYLGQGGNFNNFLTENDCMSYCGSKH